MGNGFKLGEEGISYFWAKICEIGYKRKLPNHVQEYRNTSLTGSDVESNSNKFQN
jgi:hypothetical protein